MLLDKPVGKHPAPSWLLIAFFTGSVFSTFFFNKQKLVLIITETGISINYGLLTSETKITGADTKDLRIRKYDAVKDFWGWGVRHNDKESCFTVSGDDALEIELKNEVKYLIGTQKPGEIILAIATLLPHS